MILRDTIYLLFLMVILFYYLFSIPSEKYIKCVYKGLGLISIWITCTVLIQLYRLLRGNDEYLAFNLREYGLFFFVYLFISLIAAILPLRIRSDKYVTSEKFRIAIVLVISSYLILEFSMFGVLGFKVSPGWNTTIEPKISFVNFLLSFLILGGTSIFIYWFDHRNNDSADDAITDFLNH